MTAETLQARFTLPSKDLAASTGLDPDDMRPAALKFAELMATELRSTSTTVDHENTIVWLVPVESTDDEKCAAMFNTAREAIFGDYAKWLFEQLADALEEA